AIDNVFAELSTRNGGGNAELSEHIVDCAPQRRGYSGRYRVLRTPGQGEGCNGHGYGHGVDRARRHGEGLRSGRKGIQDGAIGAADGTGEGKRGRTVDRIGELEGGNELAAGDVLLQSPGIGHRDRLGPGPGAVVGTIRIGDRAALVEAEVSNDVLN